VQPATLTALPNPVMIFACYSPWQPEVWLPLL
jgi:hypothetical protein